MEKTQKRISKDEIHTILQVAEEHHNLRLDQFVMEFLASCSRQFIKAKIAKGEVLIKGRSTPHRPSTKVHENDQVTLRIIFDREVEGVKWKGHYLDINQEFPILYEDNDIVVISKPPFITTHPSGRHIFNTVTKVFEGMGKNVHSVHRLDRETSGTLILGKNPKSAQKLTEAFEKGLVKKCYFAIAHKSQNKNFPFTANERVGKLEDSKVRVTTSFFPIESHQGKSAETIFDIIDEKDDFILLLAFPKTGRVHQIRVHAAAHGLPLLGDKIYPHEELFAKAKEEKLTAQDYEHLQIPRHALHSVGLHLPIKNKCETFIAPLPHDLNEWLINNGWQDLDRVESVIRNKVENYFKDLK